MTVSSTLDVPPPPATVDGSPRRRWGWQTLGIAIIGALLLPWPLSTGRADAAGGVVLPSEIEDYGHLTSSVANQPPGTSLLAWRSGNWEVTKDFQEVALAVDGRTYRQFDTSGPTLGSTIRDFSLAPDGRALLLDGGMEPTTAFTYLDLHKGSRRDLPIDVPSAVVIYGWSPDGRRVAFGRTPWSKSERSNEYQVAVWTVGTLAVLDVTTGAVVDYPDLGPVSAAAFSPAGDELAVQTGRSASVIDLAGHVRRGIYLPTPELGVLSGVAWSPDGRSIALLPYEHRANGDTVPQTGYYARMYSNLTLVDAAGSATVTGSFLFPYDALGWRTSGSMIGWQLGTGEVAEVSVVDGQAHQLARFEQAQVCEYFTQDCHVNDVTAATGLLPTMTVQSVALTDRGQWRLAVQLVTVVLVGGLATRVVLAVIHRRRGRRSGYRPEVPAAS